MLPGYHMMPYRTIPLESYARTDHELAYYDITLLDHCRFPFSLTLFHSRILLHKPFI